jgi:hypothetical protein
MPAHEVDLFGLPSADFSAGNMGEVFWLKLPGDSNEGVLKSVKVPEGGTDASIIS